MTGLWTFLVCYGYCSSGLEGMYYVHQGSMLFYITVAFFSKLTEPDELKNLNNL